MSLKSISIDNFRTFGANGKPANFKIAPLTILTGTNNSGKSNFFKALYTLFNSEKDYFLSPLNLNVEPINLGSFETTKCRNINKDEITFNLIDEYLLLTEFRKYKQEYVFEKDVLNLNEARVKYYRFYIEINSEFVKIIEFNMIPDKNHELLLTIDFDPTSKLQEKINHEWSLELKEKYLLKDIFDLEIPTRLTLTINKKHLVQDKIFGEYFKHIICQEPYSMIASDFSKPQFFKDNVWGSFARVILSHANESYSLDENYDSRLLDEIFEIIYSDTDYIKLLINNPFGEDIFYGGNILDIIWLVDINEPIIKLNLIDYKNFLPKRKILESENKNFYDNLNSVITNNNSINDELNKWLSFFGISEKIQLIPEPGVGFNIQVNGKVLNNIDLVDNGLGYNYLLNLIISIIVNTGSINLIEEPESHLHPALQSKLADFFVESVKSKNSLIIETHSEYLIRKLQYLIAKKELSRDDVAIYYFGEDPTSEDYIKKLDIDKNGFMKQDFGEGFFDEAARWISELWNIPRDN